MGDIRKKLNTEIKYKINDNLSIMRSYNNSGYIRYYINTEHPHELLSVAEVDEVVRVLTTLRRTEPLIHEG